MFRILILFFVFVQPAVALSGVEFVRTPNGKFATGMLGLGDKSKLNYMGDSFKSMTKEELPESFDWREENREALGFVKNQSSCGSCVSMSTMKVFEAALAIHKGIYGLNLSEQNMVDCRRGDAFGCQGAFFSAARFTLGGVASEEDYPYRARAGRCQIGHEKVAYSTKVTLLGTARRSPTVEEIKTAIYKHGPVMISAYASGWGGSGFEMRSCYRGRTSNHAIVATGWDQRGFIIMNSWGRSFGQDGFARIRYGCDSIGQDSAVIQVVEE